MNEQEKEQLNELMEFMKEKKRQQISFPLDEASRGALGGDVFPTGATGGYGTQVINTSGATAEVPAQPSGTVTVTIDGTDYNLVYKT